MPEEAALILDRDNGERPMRGFEESAQRPPIRKVVERRSSSRDTLQRELVRCRKESCKKCADGPAYGPYWHHYFYRDGRLVSHYAGKQPKDDHRERFPELFGP